MDRPWRSPLPDAVRRDALEAALELAVRCTDAEGVRAANELCGRQTQFPTALHWDPLSVAQGDLGQALLCAELASDEPWRTRAARFTADAAALLRHGYRPGMGTVGGSSGVAFVARRLAAVGLGEQLDHFLPGIDAGIARDALATAASIRGRRGLSVSSFDQISGLAGVLLCALPNGRQQASPVAPFVANALVALAREGVTSDGDQAPPAWYTPPELLFDDEQRTFYPFGNLNLGLAHGVPGPLAALALAVQHGVDTAEAREAVGILADWLAARVTRVTDTALGWAGVIALGQGSIELPPHDVGRDAWCYGTPGAARAVFLAGRALERDDLRDLAVEAMAAVYRRPPGERGIDSPTFCHGMAGLLQITLRFHHDTGLPLFADAATALTRQVLDAVDLDRPMGIANVEPGGTLVDSPGLLDGAAGVSLVLLAAATDVEPSWDRMFALS